MATKISIGRDPKNAICIDQRYDTVSNSHADIVDDEEGLLFTDHSSNGTIINNQKIRGTSVHIYQGDKIFLAGVYELQWHEINRYFPQTGRKTVTRNIHGEQQSPAQQPQFDPHATMRMNNNYKAEDPNEHLNGRATEYFNRNQSQQEQFPPIPPVQPQPQPRQQDSDNQSQLTGSGWNWGAFVFGWIWAVCHKCYWPLVMVLLYVVQVYLPMSLISVLAMIGNLCIAVLLGIKGTGIAWNTGRYRSERELQEAQRKWAIAAAIIVGVAAIFSIIAIDFILMLL